jgi:hypothetical protein
MVTTVFDESPPTADLITLTSVSAVCPEVAAGENVTAVFAVNATGGKGGGELGGCCGGGGDGGSGGAGHVH